MCKGLKKFMGLEHICKPLYVVFIKGFQLSGSLPQNDPLPVSIFQSIIY